MICVAVSLEGHTDLRVIAKGTLTAVRYGDEILRAIVRNYAGAVGPGLLLECAGSSWMMKTLMPCRHVQLT